MATKKDTTKTLKEKIGKLNEDKAWCQERVEEHAGSVAKWQRQLDDPTSAEEEKREHLKQKITHYESFIQAYRKDILDCEAEIQKLTDAIERTALSNRMSRRQFSQTKQLKCASFHLLRGGMHGFAGSGKSHTLAMLVREDPPSKRVSTAIAQDPVRTITHMRGIEVGTEKTCSKRVSTTIAQDPVRDITHTRIEVGTETFSRIRSRSFTNRLLKTAKDSVTVMMPSSTVTKLHDKLCGAFYRPVKPVDPVEKDLIVKFHLLDDLVESLKGHVICEMSDFGGQPQFLEILPRFLENMDFSIIVTDLSQNLDDHPLNYYYNKEGKSVGKGVESPLTNMQVLRLCLRMIASQSQGAGRRVRFAVVGTHRDLEGKCPHRNEEGGCIHTDGECAESRERKNQRLFEMVESFGLGDNAIYRNRCELIFAINAQTPEEVDQRTINELRVRLLDTSMAREITIPVSYYAVELTLKNRVQESGHIAFRESEVLSDVTHYHFTEETLKEALRYLHDMKRVFYYEKSFPGLVMGEPQLIFNKHTEIVAYNIELTTNPLMGTLSLDTKWWKFAQQGVLTVECLKKFPSHYVKGVFSPAHMVKLFEKLLIVSEVREGEYLMPCVLRVDPQVNCNPEPETQSLPPMVLFFPEGPVRYGVFCGTICHVMTKSKWKLLKDDATNDLIHIARNSVHFTVPGTRGKVTINDPFDSFFLITIHVPLDVPAHSETVSHLCMKVRDTLISAINKATKKLNYSPDAPKVAFLCSSHFPASLHPAVVADVGEELLCTRCCNTTGGPLTASHKIWLRESVPLQDLVRFHDKPLLQQLICWKVGGDNPLRIIQQIGVGWKMLASVLGFDHNVVETIGKDSHYCSEDACQETFCRWLNGEACQPTTWEVLVQALEDAQRRTLANEVKKRLMS